MCPPFPAAREAGCGPAVPWWRRLPWLLVVLALGRWGLVASQPARYFVSSIRIDSLEWAPLHALDLAAATALAGLAFLAAATLARRPAGPPSWLLLLLAHLAGLGLYALVIVWSGETGQMHQVTAWLYGLLPADELLAILALRFGDPPWPALAFAVPFLALPLGRDHPRLLPWLPPLAWLACLAAGPALFPTAGLTAVFRLVVVLTGLLTWLLQPGPLPWWGQAAPTLLLAVPWVTGVAAFPRASVFLGYLAVLNLGVMLIARLLAPPAPLRCAKLAFPAATHGGKGALPTPCRSGSEGLAPETDGPGVGHPPSVEEGAGGVGRGWPGDDLTWLVPFVTLALAGYLPKHFGDMIRLLTGALALPALVLPELVLVWAVWWVFGRLPDGSGKRGEAALAGGLEVGSPGSLGPAAGEGRAGGSPSLSWPATILRRGLGLLASLYVIATLVDTRVFGLLGVRLSWSLLDFAGQLGIAIASIRPYLTPSLVGGVILVFWLGQRDAVRLGPPPPFPTGGRAAALLGTGLGSLLLLGLLQPALRDFATPTWWNLAAALPGRLVRATAPALPPAQHLRELAAVLPFPQQVLESRPPTGHNLLLVMAESMHTRYLSLYGAPFPTQPALASFSPRMRLFTRIHCSFLATENANFAILNGLHPPAESMGDLAPTLGCPSLVRVLADHGYRVSYYYPGERQYRNFASWLNMQPLEGCFDQANMPGRERWHETGWGLDERCLKDAILERCRGHRERGERFAVIFSSLTPHHPFPLLDPARRVFTPTVDEVAAGLHLRAGYLNQLVFMDDLFADLLAGLQREGLLDSTLVVFVADHGEALGEEGMLGHGFIATPDLTNIFCAMLEPGRTAFVRDPTPGSQIDLMPTILDALDIPMPAGHPYQGRSLLATGSVRPILVSSFGDRAVLTPDRFLRLPEAGPGQAYAANPATAAGPLDFATAPLPLELAVTGDRLREVRAFEERQRSLLLDYDRLQKAYAAGGWQGSGTVTP
ncbi:MAG: LTA synthase family protein [Candidatus Riflebacteria bacterium]|nr:LTA synthase family protein [Candidatus Riflebacteria bacterium]